MLSGVLGRSVLFCVRCDAAQKRVQPALACAMRTPRRGAKAAAPAAVAAGTPNGVALKESVIVTKTTKTLATPRKGVIVETVEANSAVIVESEQTPTKAGGKRKGSTSGATKSTKASTRSPSARVGVLSDDELAARAASASQKQAEAQATDAPNAEGGEGAEPAPKKKRQKKQAWPPGPIYDHLTMRPPAFEGPATRIVSWNVAGLRSLLKKEPDALRDLVQAEQAGILCLQETKLQEQHVEEAQQLVGLQDWSHTWNCSSVVKGYSGTAIISREPPLSVRHGLDIEDHDQEGRLVTAEFPHFYLLNVYTPNSGEGLRRLEYRTERWDRDFASFVHRLREEKPVIITGDLNCAHKEIDIHEPKRNLRSAGFTEEERNSFTACYTERGLVDAFRAQHPGVVAYTYFSYRMGMRAKGKGWRLDYFLVADDLLDRVHDCYHLPHIMGSDHVPIGLVLKH